MAKKIYNIRRVLFLVTNLLFSTNNVSLTKRPVTYKNYTVVYNCLCLGTGMAAEGDSPIEDIYRQQEQMESENSGGKEESQESQESVTLGERLKRYLSLHKKTGPALSDSSSVTSCLNSGQKEANSTYNAIFNLRSKNFAAQNLYGSASDFIDSLGSFQPCGEIWGAPPIAKQNFGARQNISLNFDPVALVCKNCKNDAHGFLSGGSGGGGLE
jgi:hypothetical protein